ncbi:hypothetical protein [Devosia sp. MC521]|jgi:hypothetical protein|uniref:LexA family protein n=1 Tax=Devosia sp. MC521 TaxID=2759954 RepID=UPI0015FB2C1A|nr:hypothetical protein [Devosia sp. MC521]MBJ6986913.1 hypothetical protein [Devosia sp. MC521]QMW63938.1 hypothetical protein H4N61_06375 [Devosia sp. MC521]
MTLPLETGRDDHALAEWFLFNHNGAVCNVNNAQLIDDLAVVFAEVRELALSDVKQLQAAPAAAGLTERQAEALNYITGHFNANGFAPTYRDIARRLKTSTGRVFELVSALVERGHLTRLPGRARSIGLVNTAPVNTAHQISEEA